MKIPDWWATILLSLAWFRVWRLIAEDDILDPVRRYVTRLGPDWEQDGDRFPPEYRLWLGKLISCPWCLGFWLALAWWGAWQAWPHGTLVAAAPWAIAALGALVNRLTD